MIQWLIITFGPWGLLILIVIHFSRVLLDEDKAALWRSKFYKIAFKLTGKREAEKKFISNDVKGNLNIARRTMHFGQSILPCAVDVEWVEGSKASAYEIKEGEFVVRLDPSESQEKNTVSLATILVQKTTLTGIRHSVNRPIQIAIDMNLVRNLLKGLQNKSILDWFLTSAYQPAVNADADCKKRNAQILDIDERGLFSRLLLVELDEFSKKVYGMIPKAVMANEISALIDFIHALANKRAGQIIPLEFAKTYLRIHVIWVAQVNKILCSGTQPYVDAMNICLQNKMESIYALVYDKDWLGESNPADLKKFNAKIIDLKKAISTQTVAIKDFELDYNFVDQAGRRGRATCIRYKAP